MSTTARRSRPAATRVLAFTCAGRLASVSIILLVPGCLRRCAAGLFLGVTVRLVNRWLAAVAIAVSGSLMLPVGPASALATGQTAGASLDGTITPGDTTDEPTDQTPAGDPAPDVEETTGDPAAEPTEELPADPEAEEPAGPDPDAEPAGDATVTVKTAQATTTTAARVDPNDPRTWTKFSPGHYTPPSGAKFNNPYAQQPGRRRVLTHVIRSINSSPGYKRPWRDGRRVPCPENRPRLYPSTIKIALYSIADRGFTDALIAAHRRCVSVKILMNSHLDATTSPSWARLLRNLGKRPINKDYYGRRRSFAYRCSSGCRGTAVLHSKIYLFSKTYQRRNTVMTGSSNMTSNAVRVQWNDMFTVNGSATMFRQYRAMFMAMVPDQPAGGPVIRRAGPFVSTFYPFRSATRNTDRTMAALRSIRCTGATGGAGINGRSVIYINMHSWHGTRGLYLAERIRQMYANGCYVRILYSFMGKGTYTYLTKNTGARMVARRVLFPGPGGEVAVKYSHMKAFAASGNIGGDSSAWVTWTGSNNWSDRSLRCDEVTLRIPSRGVFNAYAAHWSYIRRTHSVGWWAIYEEPGGGGRAPGDD